MLRASCLTFFSALLAYGAAAHHSIGRVYDRSERLTVSGVVTEFRLVQPHSFLTIDAAPGDSRQQLWSLEMDNYRELIQIGITPDTFRPGDRVIATGDRARNGEARLYLRRLDRPADGLRYEQMGFRPSIGRSASASEHR